MQITFWGAARTVSGSCYLLEHEGVRFLIDCGLFQGNKALKERNYGDFPFDPASLDFIILTHAHLDHSGLLPKLYRLGYRHPIYASSATVGLSGVMLLDSGYIQEMEVERKNRKRKRAGQPLLQAIYTADDAEKVQQLFSPQKYNVELSPARGIRVRLHDAGHILGSSMVEILYHEQGEERRLLFTGDLGRKNQAIVRDPAIIHRADYVVMESTYGDRLHQDDMEAEIPRFAQVVQETFQRGGNLLIPAFAVDRTQDILMLLYLLQRKKMIPTGKVFVDSPLAIQATEVFAKYPDYYDRLTKKLFHEEGKAPFVLDNLHYARTAEESKALNNIKSNAILISASGMADSGRIKHHLKHNLWRQECSVVFFGYQAHDTLGRRLVDGEKRVRIHGESVQVKAKIYNLNGFSAHADQKELLEWLGHFQEKPKQIFVTHGEESALSFAELVQEKLHMPALAPVYGACYKLSALGEPAQDCTEQLALSDLQPKALLQDIHRLLDELTRDGDVEKLLRLREYLQQL